MKTSEKLWKMAIEAENRGDYGEAVEFKRLAFEASAEGD